MTRHFTQNPAIEKILGLHYRGFEILSVVFTQGCEISPSKNSHFSTRVEKVGLAASAAVMAILIAAPLARWHTTGLESAASGANTRGKTVEAKSADLLPDEVDVESATAPARATVAKTPPHGSTPTSEVVAPMKRPVTRPGGGW